MHAAPEPACHACRQTSSPRSPRAAAHDRLQQLAALPHLHCPLLSARRGSNVSPLPAQHCILRCWRQHCVDASLVTYQQQRERVAAAAASATASAESSSGSNHASPPLLCQLHRGLQWTCNRGSPSQRLEAQAAPKLRHCAARRVVTRCRLSRPSRIKSQRQVRRLSSILLHSTTGLCWPAAAGLQVWLVSA